MLIHFYIEYEKTSFFAVVGNLISLIHMKFRQSLNGLFLSNLYRHRADFGRIFILVLLMQYENHAVKIFRF